MGLWVGCAFLLPVVIGVMIRNGPGGTVRPQAIVCIIVTGLIHAVYFRLLAAGYEKGEISLVYPIARGSGIALTAILAGLFLKETFTFMGVMGVGLISAGILSLSLATKRKVDEKKAVLLGLCVGASIVVYSFVDKIGVGYVNPVLYIWWMFLIAAVSLTPFLVLRCPGTLRLEARQSIGYAVIIGVGSSVTYLMILFAFTMGPLGYIVAVREFSVVLGALAGMVFLKERFTFMKLAAICAIVVGIVNIKLG